MAAIMGAGEMAVTETSISSVTLIRGSEQALSDLEVARLKEAINQAHPDVEWTTLSAAEDAYVQGDIFTQTAPSLFSEAKAVLVEDGDKPATAFVADFLEYLENIPPQSWLIIRQPRKTGGTKIHRALSQAGYPVFAADPLKRDDDKRALLQQVVRESGASITKEAATALVESVGSDLAEMLSSARQLGADSGGTITESLVHAFHQGRVETKVFDVADALAAKQGSRALLLARQALASGVTPVSIVAVLASKFRLLAAGKTTGLSGRDLGVQDWMLDRARRESTRWSEHGLGAAMLALAWADDGVKGKSRSADSVVELAIMQIAGY